MIHRLVVALSCIALLSSCASVQQPQLPYKQYKEPVVVENIHTAYPIILLHGLGQKADVWQGNATTYFTKDLGLQINRDVFVKEFKNPFDSINAWRDELEKEVQRVRELTGADRVVLIGYSMGGLASRAYLTKRFTDHHVRRLVTIGTPHLGSAFAKGYNWKTKYGINIPGNSIPLESPAVRDLRRPEDGGTFIRALGKYAHPLDLDYVSVIGEVNIFDTKNFFSSNGAQELFRKVLSSTTNPDELFEPGDGVVSATSQDIMNIEWFTSDPKRKRVARTIKVGSVHVEHLQESAELQRLSLEDKPEFKGAGIYSKNNQPILAIDFADYIPLQCTVSVVATDSNGATQVISAKPEDVFLHRTPEGILARVVLELTQGTLAGPALNPQGCRYKITITNKFGYSTSAAVDGQ